MKNNVLFFDGFDFNPGDKILVQEEKKLSQFKFSVKKFSKTPRPQPKDIVFVCCFSEFGCETLASLYCVPIIKEDYPEKYVIVVGWYGREYMYKHMVDEFWEIHPDFMWLREYCLAFHHKSLNLRNIERILRSKGQVLSSYDLGYFAVQSRCLDCNNWFKSSKLDISCRFCGSKNLRTPLLNDSLNWKNKAVRWPKPNTELLNKIKGIIGNNAVGIFARGRRCYGRNLQSDFYVKLIDLIRKNGYNPVWLGESQTTQECPVDDVIDFSRMDKSGDLENTLAVICNCKFTVQFWTASTRLAGIMGIPYLLFESPDQIYGNGQEGLRRKLCDFGPAKLSLNDFKLVYENNDAGIQIVEKCIREIENNNFKINFGLVSNVSSVIDMQKDFRSKVGIHDV